MSVYEKPFIFDVGMLSVGSLLGSGGQCNESGKGTNGNTCSRQGSGTSGGQCNGHGNTTY